MNHIPPLDAGLYPEMLQRVAEAHNPSMKDAPAASSSPPVDKRNPSESRILVAETESQILDNLKSKGDALANLSAVLQTTWCIAQYVERWAAHQPRTLLEVVTLVCVVLNILIYYLWCDNFNFQKPIDVRGRASGAIEECANRSVNVLGDIRFLR